MAGSVRERIDEAAFMETRGRVFFFIIASLVVLTEVANLVLGIANRGTDVPIMRSVFVPLLKVWFTYHIWATGDKQSKWLLAALMVVGAIVSLSVYTYMLVGIARVTPAGGGWGFLEIVAWLLGVRVALSLLFLSLGIFLACSPSIQAYLNIRALRRIGWM